MVFEQYFKLKWIERKEHAFFLGLVYSIVGIVSARLIFPQNVDLMSVAFTSVLLIPSLAMLLKLEENIESKEKKLSVKRLFRDHKDIFKVYIFLFLGIFLAFSVVTLIYPQAAIQNSFEAQLNSAGIQGFATTQDVFTNIIKNNMLVFIVAFILSLIYGAGAILFLTWNASVWGVVFAYFVKQSSDANFLLAFCLAIVPFLPHMVTEAIAYITAAISGGVVSKAVVREKLFSKKFNRIIKEASLFMVCGIVLVVIAAILEVTLFA